MRIVLSHNHVQASFMVFRMANPHVGDRKCVKAIAKQRGSRDPLGAIPRQNHLNVGVFDP